MDYIVLDLEWNQSPSGKESSVEHLPFEIIEIGAVRLNSDFQQTDEFHRMIRPQVYRELHFKISEVTHMNIRDLQHDGTAFKEAAREFLQWCGGDVCFCTWGCMDLTELQRNMAYYGVCNPFPRPLLYYDVQKLYSLCCGYGKLRLSLDQAVQELGIRQDRPFHRAMDDAFYTGRVMAAMDFERVREYRSVDYYRLPKTREEELRLRFPDYMKYVSRTFENREEALKDRGVREILCPRCRRALRKKVRWFACGQRLCLAVGQCPEHGLIKGKVRVKRAEYGETYVVKTLKEASEGDVELILQKREESRKKRNIRNHQKDKQKKQQSQKMLPQQ